jgi:hypothetical protein
MGVSLPFTTSLTIFFRAVNILRGGGAGWGGRRHQHRVHRQFHGKPGTSPRHISFAAPHRRSTQLCNCPGTRQGLSAARHDTPLSRTRDELFNSIPPPARALPSSRGVTCPSMPPAIAYEAVPTRCGLPCSPHSTTCPRHPGSPESRLLDSICSFFSSPGRPKASP